MKIGPIFSQHSTQMSFDLPTSCRIKTTPHFASQLHQQAGCTKGRACFQWIGEKISNTFSFIKRIFSTIFFYLTCGFCFKGFNVEINKNDLSIDTFEIIPSVNDQEIPEFVLQCARDEKKIHIKKMDIPAGNEKYLSQTLDKISKQQETESFVIGNLKDAVYFRNINYITNSHIIYRLNDEQKFEHFIDSLIQKGEDAYPAKSQKEAFKKIENSIPSSPYQKSIFSSFVALVTTLTAPIPLSDILELVKDMPSNELEDIPLIGKETPEGGQFFLPKK